MSVIVTENIKELNISNTMELKIRQIKKSDNRYSFAVNNEVFDEEKFAGSFILAFCLTVYKYQGSKSNNYYNIYDINHMDKKQFYTALS